MYSQEEMDAIIRGGDVMGHKFEPFEKVLVKETKHSPWEAHIFSRIAKNLNETASYKCLGGSSYSYCIHYAGNEHLLGTTNNPEPKHEYKWGEVVEIKHLNMEWMKGLYVTKTYDGRHQVVLHDKYNTNNHIFEYYLDEEIRPVKEYQICQ